MFQNLGIKILCLIIAGLLWLQAAATTEVVDIRRLPVRVTGLADTLTVVGGHLPETISVRIRGNRLQFLAADFIEGQRGDVKLDLGGFGPGVHPYEVSVLDVDAPGSALDVVPGVTLDVEVERLVTRSVPVELRTSGSLPEGYVFVTGIAVAPSTVDVTGPQSLVESVTSVRSADLALAGRRTSIASRVQLVRPMEVLTIRPVEVDVSAGIEVVEERLFDAVPLTVLREDDRMRIDVSPTEARVIVTGARSILQALRAEEIGVVVTIPVGIRGVTDVEAEAVVPDGVLTARVEPSTFQVLAEVRR